MKKRAQHSTGRQGSSRLRQGTCELANEDNKLAEHGGQEKSSTISTDIKTYDSETSNTVSANTDINVKRRNQSCTGFSDFVLGVKNARHQARSRPDQGHQGA